ncbi:hypothetical protein [Pedomonas mirosovicensis]|uniref:hypothetical protein n=1 Tax=Pedomonas mirosovicensis TaxID=2908641 RepID=UPI002166CE2F|nr:hypothetical protein [Pedomonas mirosovicensis]MCH8685334.1 hypothetical protein [Pedomonas mirosovicensis]
MKPVQGLVAAAALMAAFTATPGLAADKSATLDAIATDYIRLVLEVGEHEPGYVDAYYGPKDLAEAAKAHPRSVAALKTEADRLIQAVKAADASAADPLVAKRIRFLAAQLKAVRTRLDMIEGKRLPFADEAEALFGARPTVQPLTDFDPILARIDKLVPGEGPLHERVEAFRNRYIIPKDKLEAVMHAATNECKRRTLEHIKLPEGEQFTLAFVTDKPWSGYNWYKGNATSHIEVNVDLPVFIDRAVDLGCHEGYPGHHVFNMLLEEKLANQRGWKEFTVYPLFSPQSFIAEGSANFGIDLAFPGEQRLAFEQKVLFPLAGLDPSTAPALAELEDLTKALQPARYAIASEYLAGTIDREKAIELTQKYQLMTRGLAERAVKFIDTYRSYVINYGLGQDMVRAAVYGAGDSQDARWAAMEKILSEPTLPADLTHGAS